MEFKNKTIGIWGFGLVGQTVARFCAARGARILVWDDRPLECLYKQATSLSDFLSQSEKIIPSPGVDIAPYYAQHKNKWLSELDIFHHFFNKKIIAITGTLGKTSVTTLLTQSLQDIGWRVQSAGNIGTPCLDMIDLQNNLDAVVLEVSSFQLEHCQAFAPDLALWTNFFPNHLDRHVTLDNYFDAKLHLLKYQTPAQSAIIPENLNSKIAASGIQSNICYFSEVGIKQNKKIVEMALQHLTHTAHNISSMPILEHRLEYVATINGVRFINDSKSTTPQSTLAALKEVSGTGKRIILFLGGLSKGVNRADLIKQLQHKPIIVLCFGKEAGLLNQLCRTYNIISYECIDLDSVFKQCIDIMHPHDCVLFSPSGSSFDLFKNYEDRGSQFKKLVQNLSSP